MTRFQQFLLMITIAVPSTATAQQVATRVLLPFTSSPVPGANGTVWETQTWVHNRGTHSAAIAPAACLGPILCGSGLPLDPALLPARFVAAAGVSTGLLAHVTTLPGADVVFSSRIRSVAHRDDSAGTEVSAVPEEEFRRVH